MMIAFCIFGLVLSENPELSEQKNVARTFGHHFLKRISFAMIPTAFVVGVITTLLAALTVVSIKGLGVGVSQKLKTFSNFSINFFYA